MRKNNTKTIVMVIVIVIVLGTLFALPRFTDPNRKEVARWKNEADVRCLTSPHAAAQAASHIHPRLAIQVDGTREDIPANIGIVPNCVGELHTHEVNDTIHSESFTPGKSFTLGQFFQVWNQPIEREGYELTATVDGEEVKNPAETILKDGQEITLEYTGATIENSSSEGAGIETSEDNR